MRAGTDCEAGPCARFSSLYRTRVAVGDIIDTSTFGCSIEYRFWEYIVSIRYHSRDYSFSSCLRNDGCGRSRERKRCLVVFEVNGVCDICGEGVQTSGSTSNLFKGGYRKSPCIQNRETPVYSIGIEILSMQSILKVKILIIVSVVLYVVSPGGLQLDGRSLRG